MTKAAVTKNKYLKSERNLLQFLRASSSLSSPQKKKEFHMPRICLFRQNKMEAIDKPKQWVDLTGLRSITLSLQLLRRGKSLH